MFRNQLGELIEFDPKIERTLRNVRDAARFEMLVKTLEKQLEAAAMARRTMVG